MSGRNSAGGGGVQRSQFFEALDPLDEVVEDLAKVDSLDLVREKDGGVLERVVIDLDDEHDGSTLIGAEGEVGEKEIEVDVTDDEGEEQECGLKRKRTIRVVIRSRAFL
jgi:myosin protein heavy chain